MLTPWWRYDLAAGRGQRRLAADLDGHGTTHLVVVRELVGQLGHDALELPRVLVLGTRQDDHAVVARGLVVEIVVDVVGQLGRVVIDVEADLPAVLETADELHPLPGAVVRGDVDRLPLAVRAADARDVRNRLVGGARRDRGRPLKLSAEPIASAHGRASLAGLLCLYPESYDVVPELRIRITQRLVELLPDGDALV